MSDRPVRLKYLTKMKIILCIFLLYITAVSVVGQSVSLDGIVGESVNFPAAVKKGGSWMYRNVKLGDVIDSKFQRGRNIEYSGRLHWDSNSGYFSLSELRLKDSGVFTVENSDEPRSVSTFNLNVWEDNVPVSKPHLNVTRNKYRCTVLCAVERGTGATLTLYKNGEKKPYVTSPVHNHPHLDMTQTVESGTYICEAKNSVSSKTSDPLTVGAHCTGFSAGTIVASVIAVVAILIAVVFAVLYHCTNRERRAVKTLIQVNAIVDKVGPHSYDEQALLPDAHTTLMEVKDIVQKVDPRPYGFRTLIQGETKPPSPADCETKPPSPADSHTTLMDVKEIVQKVDPRPYGFRTLIQGTKGKRRAHTTLIEVKDIVRKVDPRPYGTWPTVQTDENELEREEDPPPN